MRLFDEKSQENIKPAQVLRLMLPWPPRLLSPNARGHWAKVAKAKKEYRAACAWTARSQGAAPLQASSLHVGLVFVPPSRRAFDLDNALASMKSGLDGLADVLQVDDSRWSFSIAKAAVGDIGGLVKVTVSAISNG